MTAMNTQNAVTTRTKHMQERREMPDFPGYTVSRDGKVFNAEGVERNQYMSGIPAYKYVSLPDSASSTGWQIKRVHILVAKAFVPNPEGYKTVNHIDEDKENCVYTNLEWCTQQQNVIHSLGSRRDMTGVPKPRYPEHFQKQVVAEYVHNVNRGKRSKRAIWTKHKISACALNGWIAKWM